MSLGGWAAAAAALLSSVALQLPRGERTVAAVVAGLGPGVRPRVRARVQAAGVPYPPPSLRLLAYKAERELEVWGPRAGGWVRIHTYPVLAASGGPGPKLRQGDLQVPEGRYALTGLNPMSSYHLSIRVGYPGPQDHAWARRDGRTNLGGDIFIHGRNVSIGCLAIGDDAIEELFLLVAETGLPRSTVVIAPNRRLQDLPRDPAWVGELYRDLARELEAVRGKGV
jgi:L,D-transpeptidase-like protein